MKNKNYFKKTQLMIFLTFISVSQIHATDDLNIFGSLQTLFFYENIEMSRTKPTDSIIDSHDRSSFAVQQLDIFLNKSFLDRFGVFVDLEFKLNYASQKRWGELNLQEAWVKYEMNDLLIIQAGLLIPKFNNLNEIKNRLALIPTIFRPVVYESMLDNVFSIEDFIPEKAFLQISGTLPMGIVSADYAAFMGNSESSYSSVNRLFEDVGPQPHSDYLSGVDNTDLKYKLYGARVGFHKNDETFKAGLSITHDYDNRNDSVRNLMGMFNPILGDVERWRLGMDLSFSLWLFDFQSEYINVFYNTDNIDKSNIPEVDYEDLKMSQQFLYATLVTNITDEFYTYGTYQLLDDDFDKFSSNAWVVGFGYKFNDNIVGKVEWVDFNENTKLTKYRINNQGQKVLLYSGEFELNVDYLMFAISAYF